MVGDSTGKKTHTSFFGPWKSINSVRLQNRPIFFLLLIHSGRWSLKEGILCKLCRFLGHFCCYIKKQYRKQAFCEKRKLSLSLNACLAREWNTEMMSQRKLDPFFYRPKKCPTFVLWKGTTSERKIQHFHQSNQGSSGSLFEKILRVIGSLNWSMS